MNDGTTPPAGRRHGMQGVRRALAAAVLGAALVAGAPASGGAQPTACPTSGTLQNLIDLGTVGCLAGDKIFGCFGSDITSTGFATTLTNSDILFELHTPQPGHHLHGFELIGSWFAPAGGTLDHNLRYRVTQVSGLPIITDVHLQQFGEDVLGGQDPTGFVDVAEDVCVGAEFFGGCVANGGFIRSLTTFYSENPALYGPNVHEASEAWFPGVTMIDVDKDISVFGGTGGALFSNVHQDGSQVPEPATVALLAGGLGLLGVAARVRRRA